MRDRGDIVFATRDPFEALEVAGRIQVDLLVLDGHDRDLERDLVRALRAIQPVMRVLYVGPDPVPLCRLEEAVAEELSR